MKPLFIQRKSKRKQQVRFLTTPEIYGKFTGEVKKNGLYLQDVFEDLMVWFIEDSRSGQLKIKKIVKVKRV